MIRNFSYAYLHLYITLSEASVKVLGTVFIEIAFLWWLLSFKNSSDIIHGSLLSDMSFENIFRQSVACLLNHLPMSCRTELLILMKSRLSIICSCIVHLVSYPKSLLRVLVI